MLQEQKFETICASRTHQEKPKREHRQEKQPAKSRRASHAFKLGKANKVFLTNNYPLKISMAPQKISSRKNPFGQIHVSSSSPSVFRQPEDKFSDKLPHTLPGSRLGHVISQHCRLQTRLLCKLGQPALPHVAALPLLTPFAWRHAGCCQRGEHLEHIKTTELG